MKIQLSEHFTYKKLLRFTLPSIAMMIFMSIYGVVDGFFVSNFAGEQPFTAINFIYPFVMVLSSVGFMFGAGGSALIAKTQGEGDYAKANRLFSLFVYTIFISGTLLSVIGIICIRPIALWMGASEGMIEYCITYGRILLIALPFGMLQFAFQTFFSTAEKPTLGFIVTLIAGGTNMLLDGLFIAVFEWGVAGAAIATGLSQAVGGILPLVYFFRKNGSVLRLGKTRMDIGALGKASSNGMSEFLSNVASSVIGMLYNAQLMDYAGDQGGAAYGVLMYVCFIFFAIFLGYAMGVAPIIGYHFGAQNNREVKSVFHKSLRLVGVTSLVMTCLCMGLARPLALLFVGYNPQLVELTVRAFIFYAFVFLFAGIGILGSSFFTALNNGFISALISFLRVLVFQVAAVLLFPLILGTDGIWLSVGVAEFASLIVTVICLLANRKKYGY